jgi:hypothetical protein
VEPRNGEDAKDLLVKASEALVQKIEEFKKEAKKLKKG